MINYFSLGFYRLIILLLYLCPRRVALLMGALFGLLAYLFLGHHRQLAWHNLQIAFGPQLTEKDKRKMARLAFMHFGQMILDTIKFTQLQENRRNSLLRLEGQENLERAKALGRGIIIFSAHLGNWEIACWPIASLIPLHVVARPLDNPWLEKELRQIRQKLGAKVISKFHAVRPILRALQAQEAVAILMDQNVLRKEAVFVDFFGRLAATTPVVAAIHLRTGAPILPIFSRLTSDKKYEIKIHEPLLYFDRETSVDSSPKLILQITQVLTKIIEQEIRKTPEQWLWFHDRWRTRPKKENSLRFEN